MADIRVRNTINVIRKKVLDVYFASITEEIIYETKKGKESEYIAKTGDSLSKIASINKISLKKLKEDNHLKSNEVKVGQKFIIKENDKNVEKGKKVSFTKLNKATLGEEVYIVIKTENLNGIVIEINVMQGKEKVLVDKERAISLLKDDKKLLKTIVGDYAKNDKITNKDDFKNWAIKKVALAPKEEKTLKSYTKSLKSTTDKNTHLFLAVNACTSIDKQAEFYKDGKLKKTSPPNYYLNQEGEWLELKDNLLPVWMEIAWKEYKDWSAGKWTEKKDDGLKRANKYIKKAKDNFKANKKAWCGCFIHWVLKETNNSKNTNFSTVTNNPTSSQNYWEKSRYPNSKQISSSLKKPPYGCIAVLHKSGWSGHVGFLINFEKKGDITYAYLLGGNQNNKVCVQEYKVYKDGSDIKYKTKKGTIYKLKGYVYPEEFKIDINKKYKNDYKTKGYTIEDAISTN